MNPGLLIKLRPTGPWRSGPDTGLRNRVDPVYHSDSLYGAVTSAMARLESLEEWLDATARNAGEPAVRFSSCFPFLEDVGFVIPPRTLWPPFAGAPLAATRVRWKGARFIPLGVVSALIAGQPLDEDHWVLDGVSECLLPVGRQGPFRTSVRWASAVDRLSGAAERHSSACVEFRQGAGLWTVASFADEEARSRWADPVRAAFRLLADTGFGGERSRGWGRSEQPEFVEGALPDMILPPVEAKEPVPPETPAESEDSQTPTSSPQPPSHWLLSLFTPSTGDAVDWSRGNYVVARRGGRTESPARHGELKKHLTMVCEGSVLVAGEALRGAAPDVAPDGFPHPVFHAGYALSIPIPGQVTP